MNKSTIEEIVYSLGADVCGIASVERFINAPKGFHPNDILPGAVSVIVFGKQSPMGVFESPTNVPYTLTRNKIYDLNDSISLELTFRIEAEGYKAVPIPSSNPYEYWDAENKHGRGILSLKHSAELAGLGRIGKNTLLINDKYGNRLWLGAVIVDAVLEPDPITQSLCIENCTICLDSCPQSALDGTTINQKKCREICYTNTHGGVIYTCNICRKVCPFLKR